MHADLADMWHIVMAENEEADISNLTNQVDSDHLCPATASIVLYRIIAARSRHRAALNLLI